MISQKFKQSIEIQPLGGDHDSSQIGSIWIRCLSDNLRYGPSSSNLLWVDRIKSVENAIRQIQ